MRERVLKNSLHSAGMEVVFSLKVTVLYCCTINFSGAAEGTISHLEKCKQRKSQQKGLPLIVRISLCGITEG